MSSEGALILVVGPSGAGKDSILRGARTHVGEDRRIRFARRFITREAGADEDNDCLSPRQFSRAKALGGFLLSWDAHGLNYGLPASIGIDLVRGVTVIANVSRGVVEAARASWPNTHAVFVTASGDVLRQRLQARGRREDIESRLARAAEDAARLRANLTIVNDGPLESAVLAFVSFVERVSASALDQRGLAGVGAERSHDAR